MDFTHFAGVAQWARERNLNLYYAACLFAQAKFETGNFTSNVYCNANNAFGMRIASVRVQNRIGVFPTSNGEFALYADVKSSFDDRVALDNFNQVDKIPDGPEDCTIYMAEVLNRGYVPASEVSNYFQAWKGILSQVLLDNRSELNMSSDDYNEWSQDIGNEDFSDADSITLFGGFRVKAIIFLIGAIIGFFLVRKFLKKRK